MWGDSTITLGLVEAARDEGLDVTIDQYPYTAGSTGLANVIPAWARAGSREDFQARLDDPETRARIKAETIDILNGAQSRRGLVADFGGLIPDATGVCRARPWLKSRS